MSIETPLKYIVIIVLLTFITKHIIMKDIIQGLTYYTLTLS